MPIKTLEFLHKVTINFGDGEEPAELPPGFDEGLEPKLSAARAAFTKAVTEAVSEGLKAGKLDQDFLSFLGRQVRETTERMDIPWSMIAGASPSEEKEK